MNQQDPQIYEVKWLIDRCSSIRDKSSPLPAQQTDSLKREIDNYQVKGQPGLDMNVVVDRLLGILDIEGPDWKGMPVRNELPMVAILPGTGFRIVYGYSEDGVWLVEGPDGNDRVTSIPDGSRFHALRHRSAHAHEGVKFLDVIKAVFASRKNIFLRAGTASVLSNVFTLFISFYSLQVYDRVIPTQGISTLIVLTVTVILIMLLDQIVKFARNFMMEGFVKDVDHEISHRLFFRLRMDQFPPSVGSLASQVRGYDSIRMFASTATLYILFDVPFGIIYLLVMVAIAGPLVALVASVFFALSIITGLTFRKKIEENTEKAVVTSNKKLGVLVDSVDGAETIKTSGAWWQMVNLWDTLNHHVLENEGRTRFYTDMSNNFAGFMQQLSYILIVATGAFLAAQNKLTAGAIIACSILSSRVLAPIGMLPGLILQWGHAKVAYKNLENIYSLETDNHGIVKPLMPDSLRGEYDVRNIRFSYKEQNDAVAIDRLKISAGEKIGLLGVVGSGKSTFLKLLAGLYKPQSGQILLDSLNYQQVSRQVVSKHIGYVHQHVHLFAGTLRDNLTLGLTSVTDNRILEVSEMTGLNQLIANHPKGLDLQIAEGGSGVSGGQRQLIAVTRLLLAHPSIWLLDEPTASMDDRSEKMVISAFAKTIRPEDTMVLVTHKPVMLTLVDRLIIMNASGIVMDGPRDEVLSKLQNPQVQNVNTKKAVPSYA